MNPTCIGHHVTCKHMTYNYRSTKNSKTVVTRQTTRNVGVSNHLCLCFSNLFSLDLSFCRFHLDDSFFSADVFCNPLGYGFLLFGVFKLDLIITKHAQVKGMRDVGIFTI